MERHSRRSRPSRKSLTGRLLFNHIYKFNRPPLLRPTPGQQTNPFHPPPTTRHRRLPKKDHLHPPRPPNGLANLPLHVRRNHDLCALRPLPRSRDLPRRRLRNPLGSKRLGPVCIHGRRNQQTSNERSPLNPLRCNHDHLSLRTRTSRRIRTRRPPSQPRRHRQRHRHRSRRFLEHPIHRRTSRNLPRRVERLHNPSAIRRHIHQLDRIHDPRTRKSQTRRVLSRLAVDESRQRCAKRDCYLSCYWRRQCSCCCRSDEETTVCSIILPRRRIIQQHCIVYHGILFYFISFHFIHRTTLPTWNGNERAMKDCMFLTMTSLGFVLCLDR